MGGIFNFEGGMYAKVIRLSPTAEPGISRSAHPAVRDHFGKRRHRPGLRRLDLDDEDRQPLDGKHPGGVPHHRSFPELRSRGGIGDHRKHKIFMLACAAFGLASHRPADAGQAAYHFLSG